MEIWKDIDGYEGLYMVSNLGRVKSLNYRNTGKEKILKPQKNTCGYLQVNLYKDGKMKTLFIHRLVANAFIPNPENLPQVNHKDEEKTNNSVDNLEFCDSKYNNTYATRLERVRVTLTNRKDFSKRVKCVETRKIYSSTHQAERETDISHQSISSCCLGKSKTAGGYHWQYI